jgi:hypothetical protein
MSKSGGAILKVIPPARGGPQEHTGPPPGIGGGPAGFPVKSIISFCFLSSSLPLLITALNLPSALDLVANPRVVFFLLANMVDAWRLKYKYRISSIEMSYFFFFLIVVFI